MFSACQGKAAAQCGALQASQQLLGEVSLPPEMTYWPAIRSSEALGVSM